MNLNPEAGDGLGDPSGDNGRSASWKNAGHIPGHGAGLITDFASSDPVKVLQALYRVAAVGHDRSSRIGAAIQLRGGGVLWACNQFLDPRMAIEPESYTRPEKYDRTIHAEALAIASAAGYGVSTGGATMIATWAACSKCAASIIAGGIRKLIIHREMYDLAQSLDHWSEEVDRGHKLMHRCGVEIEFLSAKIGSQGLIQGKWYDL